MSRYFDAFDNTYTKGYLIGEMIWNFADFATKQGPFKKKKKDDQFYIGLEKWFGF